MTAEVQVPTFQTGREPGGWRLPLLVAALAGGAVLGGILWLGSPFQEAPPASSQPLPPLDASTEAYVQAISVSELELSRWQNFLGQTVTYLDATLTNSGPRTILALELTIEFQDLYGQVVLREKFRPVGGRRPSAFVLGGGPLGPGTSRRFRAGFEHLPADWNRALPQVRVSGLLLK